MDGNLLYTLNDLPWPGHCAICRTKFRPKQSIMTDGKRIYCPEHLKNGEPTEVPARNPVEPAREEVIEPSLPEWHFRNELDRWDKEGIRTVRDYNEKIWAGYQEQ